MEGVEYIVKWMIYEDAEKREVGTWSIYYDNGSGVWGSEGRVRRGMQMTSFLIQGGVQGWSKGGVWGRGGVDGYVACLVQRVGMKVWGAKKYISL